jgi:hypothetical protein
MNLKPVKPKKYSLTLVIKREYQRGNKKYAYVDSNSLETLLLLADKRQNKKNTVFEYAHIFRNPQYSPTFKESKSLLFFKL